MARKQWLALLSTAALFGFIGGLYSFQEAIAPQIAQAYTLRIKLSLIRQPNESYDTIIRRAESVARAGVQRSFDSDILATDVSLIVIGENGGSIAPILSVAVSRSQWEEHPDLQRWARYYPNTRSLLDFDGIAVANVERGRAEAAIPKVVVNRIRIERDSDLEISYIKGSVTNQTGHIVKLVKVNYIVIAGTKREGGFVFVQTRTLNPGQEGFFEDMMRGINSGARVEVNSVEWLNDDDSAGSWQPTR